MLTYDECKNLLQPWEKRVDVSFDLFQAIGPWISCLWPLRTTRSFSARWVPQRTVVWSPSGQDMPLSLSSYHLPHPGSSTRPANQRGHTPAWKAPASHYTRPSRGAWSNSSASPGEANRRQRSVPVLVGHCFLNLFSKCGRCVPIILLVWIERVLLLKSMIDYSIFGRNEWE